MTTENIEQNESNQNIDSYTKLLNEFSESREALKKMLKDVDDCKQSVLKDVTNSNDYRNKYAREERLKTLSSFFDTEIKIRQEYGRSILSEIDVRRKLEKNDTEDIELDIREIAKQLNKLNKENKND